MRLILHPLVWNDDCDNDAQDEAEQGHLRRPAPPDLSCPDLASVPIGLPPLFFLWLATGFTVSFVLFSFSHNAKCHCLSE